MIDLSTKTILITGAAGRIGAATARVQLLLVLMLFCVTLTPRLLDLNKIWSSSHVNVSSVVADITTQHGGCDACSST